jgi:predicted AlkP superfamily pyrophosphatase or phosphodiesterase
MVRLRPPAGRFASALSFSWSFAVVFANCFNGRVVDAGNANKLLLVMIDGFRWDYFAQFDKNELPGFDKLRQTGVSAESFIPVFPSLSYVNYYSIMTGKQR